MAIKESHARLSRSLSALAVAVATLVAHPRSASAEDAPHPYPPCKKTATDAEVRAAKGAFQAGNASFNEGDYNRAIEYWEDAYRRDCSADRMLLNLARVYESNDQKRHAVNALEAFLAGNPGAPGQDQIQKRIEKLNEQIKTEAAEASPANPEPSSTTTTPEPEAAPETNAVVTGDATTSSDHRSVVPLIVAGAGGAITIVSGILYLTAWSKIHSAETACNDARLGCATSVASKGNSGRTQANIAGGFAIGGLAIAAGGLVWYFVEKPSTKTASTPSFTAGVSPAFGLGFGGVQVAGGF